jgi:NADPH:quinone reductase-like Zn-dependent oxidoreductase
VKAIRVHRYGGPDVLVLEEVPVRQPAQGEALVEVRAAGVGPWDALVREGTSGVPQTLPLTPGSDIAGIVKKIGGSASANVTLGEAIFGVTNASFTGGYAEYALASLSSIAPKPRSLTFAQAASVPVVAVTAWQMLFKYAQISKGQTVLVTGAAGNVGAYAVALAHWAGARVIAVADERDKEPLRRIGADVVIDYQTPQLEAHAASVDAAVDTVGGEMQGRSFPTLRRGGLLVSSVSPPAPALAQRYGVRVAWFIVDVSRSELERIAQLIDDGTLKTNVGIVLTLADARKAHEMLAGTIAKPRGKIVLDVTGSGGTG